MPITSKKFKTVLGCFATGVTIVTTSLNGRIHGLTVNAFTSVSLTPQLVLICIDTKAESYKLIKQSKIFTVNILTDKQKNLSQKFADPKTKENRFDDDLWKYRTSGAPVLINALAFIDCKVDSVFLSGDHHIFVGRVIKLGLNKNSKPLIYYRGKYSISD